MRRGFCFRPSAAPFGRRKEDGDAPQQTGRSQSHVSQRVESPEMRLDCLVSRQPLPFAFGAAGSFGERARDIPARCDRRRRLCLPRRRRRRRRRRQTRLALRRRLPPCCGRAAECGKVGAIWSPVPAAWRGSSVGRGARYRYATTRTASDAAAITSSSSSFDPCEGMFGSLGVLPRLYCSLSPC